MLRGSAATRERLAAIQNALGVASPSVNASNSVEVEVRREKSIKSGGAQGGLREGTARPHRLESGDSLGNEVSIERGSHDFPAGVATSTVST